MAKHDEIADRLDNAAPNIRMGRIALEQLSDAGYDIEDAQEQLDEYDGMRRADFDSAEEYRDERQSAWDDLVNIIREMEAPESEEEETTPELPTVAELKEDLSKQVKAARERRAAPVVDAVKAEPEAKQPRRRASQPAPAAPAATTVTSSKKSRWTPLNPTPEETKAAQDALVAAFTK